MDMPLQHPSFTRQPLVVRTAGIFKGPIVLQAGSELKKGKNASFEARDDTDKARIVRLKGRFIDPLPIVEVDGETVELARPLRWYEYAWMAIPMVLVVSGGALGGALGFAGAYSSAQVFRSNRSTAAKYLISGMISLTVGVVFVIAAGALQLALS
jgi:hypothetical protein